MSGWEVRTEENPGLVEQMEETAAALAKFVSALHRAEAAQMELVTVMKVWDRELRLREDASFELFSHELGVRAALELYVHDDVMFMIHRYRLPNGRGMSRNQLTHELYV